MPVEEKKNYGSESAENNRISCNALSDVLPVSLSAAIVFQYKDGQHIVEGHDYCQENGCAGNVACSHNVNAYRNAHDDKVASVNSLDHYTLFSGIFFYARNKGNRQNKDSQNY